ncbi:MAG: phosphotransferase family protein [Chloroflexota bacterium]
MPAIQRITNEVFGKRTPVTIERMEDGRSTIVYRLRRGTETFYLRVLPEVGDSFAPEAYVHTLLRQRGVHVPEVLYVEHCNEALHRSIMVTGEIPGKPISHLGYGEEAKDILIEAGRELAMINCVQVEGFGWIQRDQSHVTRLEAQQSSNRAFLLEDLDRYLSLLGGTVLTAHDVRTIRDIVSEHSAWLSVDQAHLAHGDFDVTHIYQAHGRYTGIIDFGEIRGTGPYYDLGHFRLHDGETASYRALSFLLAGYQQMAPLPPGYAQQIAFVSLLIGIRFLARGLHRFTDHTRSHARSSIKTDIELLRREV